MSEKHSSVTLLQSLSLLSCQLVAEVVLPHLALPAPQPCSLSRTLASAAGLLIARAILSHSECDASPPSILALLLTKAFLSIPDIVWVAIVGMNEDFLPTSVKDKEVPWLRVLAVMLLAVSSLIEFGFNHWTSAIIRAFWIDMLLSAMSELTRSVLSIRGNGAPMKDGLTKGYKNILLTLLLVTLVLRNLSAINALSSGYGVSYQFEFVLLGAVLATSESAPKALMTDARVFTQPLTMLILSAPILLTQPYLDTLTKISSIVLLSSRSIAWAAVFLAVFSVHVDFYSIFNFPSSHCFPVRLTAFDFNFPPQTTLLDKIAKFIFYSATFYVSVVTLLFFSSVLLRQWKKFKEFNFQQLIALIIFHRMKNELYICGNSGANSNRILLT